MSRIFWDTNLFIYLMEDAGPHAQQVVRLIERMWERNDQLCTSTLTLGELLVKPLEKGNRDLCDKYEEVLSQHAVLIPLDDKAARIYASLRCDRSLRAPDAIQLACASRAQVDLFITNDERLSQKVVPGIQFVTSLERAFL